MDALVVTVLALLLAASTLLVSGYAYATRDQPGDDRSPWDSGQVDMIALMVRSKAMNWSAKTEQVGRYLAASRAASKVPYVRRYGVEGRHRSAS